ncbi:hypothetical protein AGDE_09734 [Angomonas deanei]|uniref:Uncharacterized protein n=1 Tax=Angomonas deanei TaxID=59799 RepID=A0A7G2CA60_9TRYP|nr:hypothetical protein AGDE_09734 [Angomonas deanei]CAD2216656.1 hypothetical protein, conserved [Angomonas deanei]|eukprot:EPY29876.1 hypothetical protein AGDE_09734 [Angomonas deanei]
MNMNSDYRFSFSNVKNYPISMTLGSATTQCEFTFTYTSLNNFVVDFDIPLCIPAPTTKELAQDKESEVKNPNPMPEFPDEFSTDIQVIMPSKKTIFKMHHAYSQPEEFAHSTLQGVQPDEVGRAVEYEWYIRGKSQASYFITQKAVPPGLEMVEPKLREYFYPNVATCTKVFIGYTPLANSGAELFLVDPDKTPSYLGRETVRGVPCKVWAVLSHGSLRTWYWSDEQYTKNTSQLLRMTVRGVGLSPFFPHHPFYAQGEAFPIQDRPLVCAFMTPMMNYNVGCDDSRGSEAFEYTYEITSFVPYIPMRDTTFPELCINVDASLSVPSSACRFSGIPAALVAILLIIIAIVFLFLGCCCVWCRYSVMVRRLEEELLYVTAELRRDAEAEGAPVQDGAVDSQGRRDGANFCFLSVND